MAAYYSEWDPYAAQFLRNLIDAGHIPAGVVDTRSITDVRPSDLEGFTQCHFFAGLGGWSLAARLAGWPDDREIWTGSAPCQPFSVAGQGKAQSDDRHLWPHVARLIRARRPALFVGEQVAAAVGKDWLDGVFADLEPHDYACGAVVVPACAVDAPHRRDRLWFLAHAERQRRKVAVFDGRSGSEAGGERQAGIARMRSACGVDRPLADANGERGQVDPHAPWRAHGGGARPISRPGSAGDGDGVLADAGGGGCQQGNAAAAQLGYWDQPAAARGSAWSGSGWITGHDGKARRVEPGIRLLAHGAAARVGRLRAYGNAIVPQVAAEVIAAYMDCYPQ